MNNTDKVVTHSVDIQTALKFGKNQKSKFRTWLKSHPNFKYQKADGKWVHIYEPEFRQWQEQMNEQRNREDVQFEASEAPEEGESGPELDV